MLHIIILYPRQVVEDAFTCRTLHLMLTQKRNKIQTLMKWSLACRVCKSVILRNILVFCAVLLINTLYGTTEVTAYGHCTFSIEEKGFHKRSTHSPFCRDQYCQYAIYSNLYSFISRQCGKLRMPSVHMIKCMSI